MRDVAHVLLMFYVWFRELVLVQAVGGSDQACQPSSKCGTSDDPSAPRGLRGTQNRRNYFSRQQRSGSSRLHTLLGTRSAAPNNARAEHGRNTQKKTRIAQRLPAFGPPEAYATLHPRAVLRGSFHQGAARELADAAINDREQSHRRRSEGNKQRTKGYAPRVGYAVYCITYVAPGAPIPPTGLF